MTIGKLYLAIVSISIPEKPNAESPSTQRTRAPYIGRLKMRD